MLQPGTDIVSGDVWNACVFLAASVQTLCSHPVTLPRVRSSSGGSCYDCDDRKGDDDAGCGSRESTLRRLHTQLVCVIA